LTLDGKSKLEVDAFKKSLGEYKVKKIEATVTGTIALKDKELTLTTAAGQKYGLTLATCCSDEKAEAKKDPAKKDDCDGCPEALAKEGTRLTSFYAPSSTCTPSRAAILTGRYAPRVQGCERVLFPNDKQGIEADKEVTIATLLRKQGYATALVGKWHLGCTPE